MPNLDYADKIYDKPLSKSFKRKTEMAQYNGALIITGAFKETLREKIYQEFGLWSLWQIEDELENFFVAK